MAGNHDFDVVRDKWVDMNSQLIRRKRCSFIIIFILSTILDTADWKGGKMLRCRKTDFYIFFSEGLLQKMFAK